MTCTLNRLILLCVLIILCASGSTAKEYNFSLHDNLVFYDVNYNSTTKHLNIEMSSLMSSVTLIDKGNVHAVMDNVDEKWLKENRFLNSNHHSPGAIALCDNINGGYAIIFYTTDGTPNYINKLEMYLYDNDDEEYVVICDVNKKVSELTGDEKEFYDNFMSLKGEITGVKYTPQPNKPAPKTESKPAPKQATKQTAKTEARIVYTATVTDCQLVVKTRGSDALFPWMILFNVKDPKEQQPGCYLYMLNANTNQFYQDPITKKYYLCETVKMDPTSLYVEASQMPAATPKKKVRVKFKVMIKSPSSNQWIGEYNSPVYLWDGTYMTPE